jgi:MFS family permease
MNNFGKLWTGDLISQFGDRVTELALPLAAVATLAATPAQVGLLTAAAWAPNLLGVLAGAWVDRRPHRKAIMIAADLLRAAALITLPIAHWLDMITLTQLFDRRCCWRPPVGPCAACGCSRRRSRASGAFGAFRMSAHRRSSFHNEA